MHSSLDEHLYEINYRYLGASTILYIGDAGIFFKVKTMISPWILGAR
jgi:hypothetical protein